MHILISHDNSRVHKNSIYFQNTKFDAFFYPKMSAILPKNVRKQCLHACDFFHVCQPWADSFGFDFDSVRRQDKRSFILILCFKAESLCGLLSFEIMTSLGSFSTAWFLLSEFVSSDSLSITSVAESFSDILLTSSVSLSIASVSESPSELLAHPDDFVELTAVLF